MCLIMNWKSYWFEWNMRFWRFFFLFFFCMHLITRIIICWLLCLIWSSKAYD
jgi:hypothetical protein